MTRLTQQELDPLGAISAWPLTIGAAVIAVGLAVAATIGHDGQVRSLPIAIVAVAFVVAAGAALVYLTHESTAPFTTERMWIVVALSSTAAVAEFASTAGANDYVTDDFGSVVAGVLILGMAPYRPWSSIIAASLAAAVVLGSIAVATSEYAIISAPAALFAIVGMLPVLALGAASAGYSRRITAEIVRWQRVAARDSLSTEAEVRDGIARSVERRQLVVLGRDVLPFLDSVLERGVVEPADRQTAARLARTLRGVLVAHSDATWLSDLLEPAGQTSVDVELHDPTGAAGAMSADQRSALTALLTRLLATSERVRVEVSRDVVDPVARVTIDARIRSVSMPSARRDLQPFFAVSRSAFAAQDARVLRGVVQAGFDYELR
ncbi:hypothetical protein MN032_08605 [Agromyces atrinae]|uniref:hypothetical protein n=1 Tax=Agromyces atrinae TaxID=592376 RepID=UPI001F5ACA77|nr:hypothetical protein [Agromyces atrinae]MCI2957750.1 hypothetical protein [Agromyces atrinae]